MTSKDSKPFPEDYSLPQTLRDLRSIRVRGKNMGPWWMFWEFLRPFFKQHGYNLYRTSSDNLFISSSLDDNRRAAADSFGLYGDRDSEFYRRQFCQAKASVFAANDGLNRDVIVKVVAKGDEGKNELKILQFLQTEPLKFHPQNATIQILEVLHYEDWVFAIMPAQDCCDEVPFQTVDEVLEFSEQLISALAFLHTNCIAHLDVAYENTLINHKGVVEDVTKFRSSFPVKYALIDFGWSEYAPSNGPGSGYVRPPLPNGRPTKAHESTRRPFDPYLADVSQVASVLHLSIFKYIDQVPGLLELFQDMNRWRPASRPSMAQSLARLRDIRTEMKAKHQEALYELRDFNYVDMERIPLRHWVVVLDALRIFDFKFVGEFILYARKELFTSMLQALRSLLP